MSSTFSTRTRILKIDESLGIVFGWGMVTSESGKEYFDTQGDAITEDGMVKAASDFMANSRVAGEMHEREHQVGKTVRRDGEVLFAFPLTQDIAETFGITCEKRGLLVGVRPSAAVLSKFKSGEYTGFSIGGRRIDEEVVER